MIYKFDTAYYYARINSIGGVETHLYYLAKKYADRDFVILYRQGDRDQLHRLRKYVQVVKITDNDYVVCNRLFIAYDKSILFQCDAKEVYYVIHADYKEQIKGGLLSPNSTEADSRITKYIAVSDVAGASFGNGAETAYMPIVPDAHEEPILLMSATRLTNEKGRWRMEALAKALDEAGVNYIWHIYTNSKLEIDSENVQYLKPRLDITSKYELYDAVVQLSDSEAYCFTVVEALLAGVPVIVTPCPVFDELKITDQQAVRIPFDMKLGNKDIDAIRSVGKLKMEMQGKAYKPPRQRWDKLITKSKSLYNSDDILVEALDTYQKHGTVDVMLNRVPKQGERWRLNKDRLHILLGDNELGVPFVQIVREENETDLF